MQRRDFMQKALAAGFGLGAGAVLVSLPGCSREGGNPLVQGESSKHRIAGNCLTPPQVMDFTVLPVLVTASAWSDAAYETNLLNSPDSQLQSTCSNWPSDISFTVHADSDTVRHLPLPAFKSAFSTWTSQQMLTTLRAETERETSLDFFLPATVIHEAFYNANFKQDLLGNANQALISMGFSPGSTTFVVHENTETDYHISLQNNPSAQPLTFTQAEDIYTGMGAAVSTKDCASGTCD